MNDYSHGGRDGGMGILLALLLGMAVGAATVVLTNREMREKLLAQLEELRRKGERKAEKVKEEVEAARAKERKKIAER